MSAMEMSERFPTIPDPELSDAQQGVYRGVTELFSRLPTDIIWKNDGGQILGPYQPLLYTNDFSDEWFKLANAVMRQKRLGPKEKELCILAVLAEYDAPYVLYAHSTIALRVGLTESQVQAAVHGILPADLGEREKAIYNLALKLTKIRRKMDDETFENIHRTLSRDEIAGVTHIVSGYIYVAMLTNLSGAGVPQKREGMFVAKKNPAFESHTG